MIRNIQKTGNMHYLYLPTEWCNKNKIQAGTKVTLTNNPDSTLTIAAEQKRQPEKHLLIELDEIDHDSLLKLVMACYLNPTKSFKIQIKKKLNLPELLSKKNQISAMEFVEFDQDNISHESTLTVIDPEALIKNMFKKLKNLLTIMIEHHDEELVERFEKEIDRTNLLIHKGVTAALTKNEPTHLNPIDLHYISLLATDTERLVDNLILIEKKEKPFLKQLLDIEITPLLETRLSYNQILKLITQISQIKISNPSNLQTYYKYRVISHLSNISETLLDWSITQHLEY